MNNKLLRQTFCGEVNSNDAQRIAPVVTEFIKLISHEEGKSAKLWKIFSNENKFGAIRWKIFLFLVHENNLAGPSIPSRGFPTGVSELYREDKRS